MAEEGINNSTVVIGDDNVVDHVSKKVNKGEWQEAQKYVEQDSGLNEKQKEILKGILKEAEDADDVGKDMKEVQGKLKNFLDCAGSTAAGIEKALLKLKEIAGILKIGK